MKRLLFSLVFLLTSGNALGQAAQKPGVLTFSPSEPQLGSEVHVAYEAPEGFEHGDVVILRARLRTPGDGAYGVGTETRSVARLRRDDCGVYRGQFVYPDSAVFALFAVSAWGGNVVDTNLRRGWTLLAHGGDGRPLAEALGQQLQDLTGRDFRKGISVAQRLVSEYPDDPQSWYMLGFFEDQASGSETDSGLVTEREARVRAFDLALGQADDPDPDTVSGLVWLAGPFSETGVKWTDWLIERAPAHPTAVQFRVIRAQQEHRDSPDSTLAALDSLWDEVGPAHKMLFDTGFRTALAAADAEAALRWADRKGRAQPWATPSVAATLAAAPATREEGVRRLPGEVARVSEAVADERHLFATVEGHQSSLRAEAARLQAGLGAALLAGGDAAEALTPLEAAASEVRDADLFLNLATARSAAGDSLGAARAFAQVAADPGAADADTARVQGLQLVGPEVWSALVSETGAQLLTWTLQSAAASPLPEGIGVLDAEGEQVELEDVLSGGPTVVILYSRYCSYCVAATPQIESLRKQLDPDDVSVVIVSAEPPGAESEAFFDERGYSGLVYHDVDREAALAFGSAGVPAYFVLDRKGAVRFRFTSLGEIPRQVTALLTETQEQAR